MSRNPGYAVVDADDDDDSQTTPRLGGSRMGPSGQQLEFQSFDGMYDQQNRPPAQSSDGPTPAVPFSLFNLTYYQSYFDISTKTLTNRLVSSIIPRSEFISSTCSGRIDLYGPFWTLTTLILTVYLSTSLSASISDYLAASRSGSDSSSPSKIPQQKDLTLLGSITTLIYLYGLGFPAAFWAITRYLARSSSTLPSTSNSSSSDSTWWSLPEAWAVWGYSMVVWVPVSILCIIPIPILRWVLVGLAGASSGYFIVSNVYPILSSMTDSKLPRTLIIIIILAHALLTLIMKIVFFSYSVGGTKIGPDDPLSEQVGGIVEGGGEPAGDAIEAVKRWLSV